MTSARFFGEMPTMTFVTVTALITLPEQGYATINCITDCIFTSLNFRHAVPASQNLTAVTIPAGTTLYGVQSYQVQSGAGQAFHSSF